MARLPHRTMGVALLLVVSLGWSAVAACTDLAPTSAPQMACCLQSHQDCEHSAVECCTSPASHVGDQQSTSAKPTSSKLVPVLDLVRFVDPVPVTSTSPERIVRWFDQAPARPPDIPTYLLDSVFLL